MEYKASPDRIVEQYAPGYEECSYEDAAASPYEDGALGIYNNGKDGWRLGYWTEYPGDEVIWLRPLPDWRSIATPPKNGEEVLLWSEDGGCSMGSWNGFTWTGCRHPPTLWMPLPWLSKRSGLCRI